MTAEGSTGAPLRQQIAEAIGQNMVLRKSPTEIADAVVALLNLTEETGTQIEGEPVWPTPHEMSGPSGEPIDDYRADFWAARGVPIKRVHRERIDWSGPWLPSTSPDTSSSDPA